MPEEIRVVPTGDAENCVEGGYNYLYTVMSQNVSPENGKLEYENLWFPLDCHPNKNVPKPGDVHTVHLEDLSVVDDEILDLLRERGVSVIILEDESPSQVMLGVN